MGLRTFFLTPRKHFVLGGRKMAAICVRHRVNNGRKGPKRALSFGRKGSSIQRVGRSTGLRSEWARENHTHISNLCTSCQKRPTRTSMAPAFESPRTRAARQLLSSRNTKQRPTAKKPHDPRRRGPTPSVPGRRSVKYDERIKARQKEHGPRWRCVNQRKRGRHGETRRKASGGLSRRR